MADSPLFHHLDPTEEHARLVALRSRIDARIRRLVERINPDVPPFERLGHAVIAALMNAEDAHG